MFRPIPAVGGVPSSSAIGDAAPKRSQNLTLIATRHVGKRAADPTPNRKSEADDRRSPDREAIGEVTRAAITSGLAGTEEESE
jgi:hypothetical protein